MHKKPFIIAEISGNHKQSLKRALKLIDAAADAGAGVLRGGPHRLWVHPGHVRCHADRGRAPLAPLPGAARRPPRHRRGGARGRCHGRHGVVPRLDRRAAVQRGGRCRV